MEASIPEREDSGRSPSPPPLEAMDFSRAPLAPHHKHLRPPSQNLDERTDFIPDPDGDDDGQASDSDLKRVADDIESFRPLKRQKGIINGDYLDLLNAEIKDAALRIDSLHQDAESLRDSQMGLTHWSDIEKSLLFESVSRLGRDDAPAIAARIVTKSEFEVRAFIQALEDAKTNRDFVGSRQLLAKAEHPAALELSQQCCHALDEAADAISLRQERKEQSREESKWGDTWDLTPGVARRLHKGDGDLDDGQMPSLQLFNLNNWLKLSQHVFMNSSIPGDNWNHIDNKPPSIWATTLEDFYSLTLSLTKRIVQTTIFTASARLRAGREYRPHLRKQIRKSDVAAAIASLDLPTNADEFWRKSARRLRINVYDEDNEEDEEAMSFDDVEVALGGDEQSDSKRSGDEEESELLDSSDDNEDGSQGNSPDSLSVRSIDNGGNPESEEQKAIEDEAREVFLFSATTYSETRRQKRALMHRIAVERQQEQFAEAIDQHANHKEEMAMWNLLQKTPPFELPRVPDPGRPQKSVMDVESMFSLGRNWRDKAQYRGQWEETSITDQK